MVMATGACCFLTSARDTSFTAEERSSTMDPLHGKANIIPDPDEHDIADGLAHRNRHVVTRSIAQNTRNAITS